MAKAKLNKIDAIKAKTQKGIPTKKILLISLPTVAVLVFVVAYLFSIPTLQTNDYKAIAKSNQLALSSSASKAIDSESQHAYFAQDVSVAEAKSALKVSQDAASDLESKINANEKGLTDFTELPLVSTVNNDYKNAVGLKSLESQYVKATKDYLTEFKSVNMYFEQTLPLVDISDQITSISNDIQNAGSVDELTAAIDKVIAKLDQATGILSSVKPPESVKGLHDANVASINDLTAIMKQLKAAVLAQDADTFTSLGQTFNDKQTAYEKQFKDLETKFVDESKLAKSANAINQLSKQIDAKNAN